MNEVSPKSSIGDGGTEQLPLVGRVKRFTKGLGGGGDSWFLAVIASVGGAAALLALVLAIVANYNLESTNLKVDGLERAVATKADHAWVVGRLATKADKVEVTKLETMIKLLAERSVVDQLAAELKTNGEGDAGRELAISDIRRALGAKADEVRVAKLERRLRSRIRGLTTDLEAVKAILDREGGVNGPPSEPKKYIIP